LIFQEKRDEENEVYREERGRGGEKRDQKGF
jgi:hypothetical protein